MRKIKQFGILPLALVLFAVAACDGSKKQIVGKWKTDSQANSMTWEFFADGTLLMGETIRGNYNFGDQKRIKIQTPSATLVEQVEISEGRMVWKDPGGATTSLTKVK